MLLRLLYLLVFSQLVLAQEAPVEPKKTERQQMDSILQRELSNQPFQKEEAPQEQENGWFWQLMKTSATLGVLLLGFYGFTKLVKFKQNLPRQQYSAMQLLYSFPLQAGRQIQILEMAGRLYILGVTETGITLLSEIQEKALIDRIKLDIEKDSDKGEPDFMVELSKALKNKVETLFSTNPVKDKQSKNTQLTDTPWDSWRAGGSKRLEQLRQDRNFLRGQDETS